MRWHNWANQLDKFIVYKIQCWSLKMYPSRTQCTSGFSKDFNSKLHGLTTSHFFFHSCLIVWWVEAILNVNHQQFNYFAWCPFLCCDVYSLMIYLNYTTHGYNYWILLYWCLAFPPIQSVLGAAFWKTVGLRWSSFVEKCILMLSLHSSMYFRLNYVLGCRVQHRPVPYYGRPK